MQSEYPGEEGLEEEREEDGGDHVGGADLRCAEDIESDEDDDQRACRRHIGEDRACEQVRGEEGEGGDGALIEEDHEGGEGATDAEGSREGEAGDGINHGLGENDVGVSRGIGNRAGDRHCADTEEQATCHEATGEVAVSFATVRELLLDECAEALQPRLKIQELADDRADGEGENHNQNLTQVVGKEGRALVDRRAFERTRDTDIDNDDRHALDDGVRDALGNALFHKSAKRADEKHDNEINNSTEEGHYASSLSSVAFS